MFKKILLIFISLSFLTPLATFAFQEISGGTNLVAEVKPTSPKAGEQVTIKLSGYGFNIDTSSISWSMNDRLSAKGTGQKTFTFNMGPVGEQIKITAYVQAVEGQKASKVFIFDSSEIELFWETNTSKPAFYKGKALPSSGSDIRVVALPYLVNRLGKKIDTTSLVYNWKKNDAPLNAYSGLGKNIAIINTSKKDSQIKISVEAKSPAENITANNDLFIDLVKPEIIFYEKKPLEGVNYGKILDSEYSLFNDEVTVRAESYFLPTNNLLFRYLWQVDRTQAQGRSDDPWAITLKKALNVSGSNLIDFTAQSGELSASNSFIIKYGSGLFNPAL